METKEYFQSRNWNFLLGIVFVIGGALYSIYLHRYSLEFWGVYSVMSLFLIFTFYFDWRSTYFLIQNRKTVSCRGYRNLKRDRFNIENIVYVARGMTYGLGGRRIFFYYTDIDGTINHSSMFESHFSNEVIRQLIKRLVELKPNVEIHEDYKQLLLGKELDRDPIMLAASMGNSGEFEKALRAKGYTIKSAPWSDRFLGY